MKRLLLATLLASAFACLDASAQGVVGHVPTDDKSRSSIAALQCRLSITTTAAMLSDLWAAQVTAGKCLAMPASPSFAFILPTGGAIYYRTDGIGVTVANGLPVASGQAWPIEGPPSIANLQMIANGTVSIIAEVRN